LIHIITYINLLILYYFILLSIGYLILLIGSIPDILFRFKENEIINIQALLKSYIFPPVSVIMPFYNEKEIVLDAIKSVLNSDYPNVHLILVNDGSTDTSLQMIIDAFHMYPVAPLIKNKIKTHGAVVGYYISDIYKNLTLIDTEHSDKSDTMNVGINANRAPLFISIDSDTLIEPDGISQIIFYYLRLSYPVAVGGGVYVLNGCTFQNGVITEAKMSLKPIHIFQSCEYLRSFLFARSGWNAFGGALCYAGAFSLINNHSAMFVGGYDVDNLAQDFEIITHLHEYSLEKKFPYHIGFTPSAIVWTDVPSTLGQYWHQRFNWQYYSLRSLLLHKKMLFNPRFGVVGLFTYPFYLFGEILGAIVECTAYILMIMSYFIGIFDLHWAALFFTICFGFSTFLTMATALLSLITFNKYQSLSDIILILEFSILENFGFRQYNVICRVAATFKYAWDAIVNLFKPK
jgi:biofilm PGA synthesis N-glycosyltransferase PgaC